MPFILVISFFRYRAMFLTCPNTESHTILLVHISDFYISWCRLHSRYNFQVCVCHLSSVVFKSYCIVEQGSLRPKILPLRVCSQGSLISRDVVQGIQRYSTSIFLFKQDTKRVSSYPIRNILRRSSLDFLCIHLVAPVEPKTISLGLLLVKY